jgi:uncharacterized protein (DUF1697 family)
VVFKTNERAGGRLQHLLEAALAKQLGRQIDCFVRGAAEWRAIVARNPFPGEAKRDPGHLLVFLLKQAPAPAQVKALQAAISGREVARVRDSHAYIYFPDGVGTSKLTSSLMDSRLGTRGTGRNWNTVLKIDALAGA